MPLAGILETVLYAENFAGLREFYEGILGLEVIAEEPFRHLFIRCGNQVLLIFNPAHTRVQAGPHMPPPHGASGRGHVCFRATEDEIEEWRLRLERQAILVEADVSWPRGGRSIYFRDPSGNSLEIADARIWGLQ